MPTTRIISATAAVLALVQGLWAQGNLTYPGCNVTYRDQDWAQETLVKRESGGGTGGVLDPTMSEPVKAAVGTDPEGNIEVYFVELRGGFKVYRAKSKTVHLIQKVTVDGSGSAPNPEEGLMGVV